MGVIGWPTPGTTSQSWVISSACHLMRSSGTCCTAMRRYLCEMDAITNCTRHAVYENRQAALGALAALRHREIKPKGRPEPFKCKVCGNWHIGRKPGTKRRR